MSGGPARDAGPIVVKLGGSVLTEKHEPETVDRDALRVAARALGAVPDPLVVVHGGGSFGHHHAAERGITASEGSHDGADALAVHGAMAELNRVVVDALQAADCPGLPVHPLSVGARDDAGGLSLPTAAVEGLLGEGFVPVLHGDVLAHRGRGVTVLSGDELVVSLGDALDAERVGVCSSVPGVLDADGSVIDRIHSVEAVRDVVGGSDATDVTGGMEGKVDTLLRADRPVDVFGLDGLEAFLAGASPGTTVGTA